MKINRVIAQFVFVLLSVVVAQAQQDHLYRNSRARLYEPIIAAAAARHKVDPYLLWTIAYLESRFRPEAISYKNGKPCARGLMQLIPATAERYGVKNPHSVEESVEAAARYVRDLQTRFGGRNDLILAAYNSGEGTVEAFRNGKTLVLPGGKVINPNAVRTDGIPPYKETRNYVANGRTIYFQISGKDLVSFNSSTRAAGATSASRPVEAERSIYSNTESRPSEMPTSPKSSSLYPN